MKRTIVLLAGLAWGGLAAAEEPAAPVRSGPAAVEASEEVGALLAGGRNCLQEGRWMEAVALFEKARVLKPGSQEAEFGLSAALMELKRYNEALPMLEQLAKSVPESPMVKNNLAWVLIHVKGDTAGNAARAVRLARSALLDVPSDINVWNTLGEAYYAAGQYDKALKAGQSGLQLSLLAGITNSPCRSLVARSRDALGKAGAAEAGTLQPE